MAHKKIGHNPMPTWVWVLAIGVAAALVFYVVQATFIESGLTPSY